MGNYLTSSNKPTINKNESFNNASNKKDPRTTPSIIQTIFTPPKIKLDPKKSIFFGLKEISTKMYKEKVGNIEFYVQLMGTDNKTFQEEIKESSIQIRIGGIEEIIPKTTLDEKKGLISIDFISKKSGTYFISIKIENVEIPNSPFQLILEPSELDLTLTSTQPNLEEFLQVGATYSFKVQFFDLFHNSTNFSTFPDGFQVVLSRNNKNYHLQSKVELKEEYYIVTFQPLEQDIQDIQLNYFDVSLFLKKKVPILSNQNFQMFKKVIEEKNYEFKANFYSIEKKFEYETNIILNQNFLNIYYYLFYFFKINLFWNATRDYKLVYNLDTMKLEIHSKKEKKLSKEIIKRKDENDLLIYSIYKVFSRRQRVDELMMKIRDLFETKEFDKENSMKLYNKSIKMKKTFDLFMDLWKNYIQDSIKSIIELDQKIGENLIEEYERITFICKKSFIEDVKLYCIIQEEFSKVFTLKDKNSKDIITHIILFGSELLKNDQLTDQKMDRYLSFITLCKDKDIFIEYYKLQFAKRIINLGDEDSTLVYNERKMISKIKTKFGVAFVGKLEGLMKEKIYSKDLTIEFRKESKLDIKMETLTFNSTQFPAVSNEALVVPNEISTYLVQYEKFYKSKHSSRKLTWFYSLGSIQLIGRWKSGEYTINLEPCYGFVLILFNSMPEISIKEIESILKMSSKRLNVILKKLEMRKMIQINGTKVCLNEEFQSKNTRINFKEESVSTKQEDKSIQKSVNLNRNFEIEACIVRIMKSKKIYSHKELVIETTKQLLPYFQVQPMDIRKRIDDLINRDFISRSEDQKDVYIYMP